MEKKTDFKGLSNKAKVQYVWDYYRWPIIITVCIAAFVISLISHYITYREPLLNVIMINCNDPMNSTDDGFDAFLEQYGYENYEGAISLSSSLTFYEGQGSASYNDLQVLTMMVAAGGQDLFFGTGDRFLNYAEQGALTDLSTILPEETLEKYKDCLLYSTDNGESAPYPCAIELTGNQWLESNNYYNTCYFGIFSQTTHMDTCAQFAEFILNQ